MNKFMKIAAEEALKGMRKGDGGPFGAVIVCNGKIIAKAHNTVLKNNDATCHAEVNAIRKASKKLKKFDLGDCEIYASCEPCPMCLSSIYWARIKKIYYGCSEKDAEEIGFDDKRIDEIFKGKRDDLIKIEQIDRQECLKPFSEFNNKKDKRLY